MERRPLSRPGGAAAGLSLADRLARRGDRRAARRPRGSVPPLPLPHDHELRADLPEGPEPGQGDRRDQEDDGGAAGVSRACPRPRHRIGLWLAAFVWGLAEATALLRRSGCSADVRRSAARIFSALVVALFVVAGAMLGGLAMWWIGGAYPEAVAGFLDHIPAISRAMIEEAGEARRAIRSRRSLPALFPARHIKCSRRRRRRRACRWFGFCWSRSPRGLHGSSS